MTGETINRLVVDEAMVLLGVVSNEIKPRTMVVDAAFESRTRRGFEFLRLHLLGVNPTHRSEENPSASALGFFYALMVELVRKVF